MYRILKCTEDAYVQNKVVNGSRCTDANVGQAGTLDFYKLYDESALPSVVSGVVELSRTLVKFDLDPIRALTGSVVDINSSDFKCYLNLKDIYGGQTVPSNYSLNLFPLAKPFDEGRGLDVIAYRDLDTVNFLSASTTQAWNGEGASAGGTLGTSNLDYYTSGNIGAGVVALGVNQVFARGDEDLRMDITSLVSATIAGILPDYGFRLSFHETLEQDENTYFVKRFGSRHVSNPRLRPNIQVLYNDAINDQTSDLYFDTSNTVFLYNTVRGVYTNIISASTPVTGDNCLLLSMAPVTSSAYECVVTGSQYKIGDTFQTGVYYATFNPSSISVNSLFEGKSFLKFNPTWKSLDRTVPYFSGSVAKINKVVPTSTNSPERRLVINVTNLRETYYETEQVRLRVFAQDFSAMYTPQKLPTPNKSLIFSSMYYRIRDAFKGTEIVPFETTYHSTRLSTDSEGMYFDLYMADLDPGFVYSLEFLLLDRSTGQIFGEQTEYVFKVVK